MCDDPACRDAEVRRDNLGAPHFASHDIVKVRAVLPVRSWSLVYGNALASIVTARKMLEEGIQSANAPERWMALESESSGMDEGGAAAQEAAGPTLRAEKEGRDGSGRLRPRCIACNEAVEAPCWYCARCPGKSSSSTL